MQDVIVVNIRRNQVEKVKRIFGERIEWGKKEMIINWHRCLYIAAVPSLIGRRMYSHKSFGIKQKNLTKCVCVCDGHTRIIAQGKKKRKKNQMI
jgi:hypothetical protein